MGKDADAVNGVIRHGRRIADLVFPKDLLDLHTVCLDRRLILLFQFPFQAATSLPGKRCSFTMEVISRSNAWFIRSFSSPSG